MFTHVREKYQKELANEKDPRQQEVLRERIKMLGDENLTSKNLTTRLRLIKWLPDEVKQELKQHMQVNKQQVAKVVSRYITAIARMDRLSKVASPALRHKIAVECLLAM